MVLHVTRREDQLFIRQVEDILASFTGPRIEIPLVTGGLIRTDYTWNIRNDGDAPGRVSFNMALKVDGFFGDSSKIVALVDGSLIGPMSSQVRVPSGNFPLTIAPGATELVSLSLTFAMEDILAAQESKTGFNWWVAELRAIDIDADQLIGGDSVSEIRDWFRIVLGAATGADLTVGADPTFRVTAF